MAGFKPTECRAPAHCPSRLDHLRKRQARACRNWNSRRRCRHLRGNFASWPNLPRSKLTAGV
eukprot:7522712-Pyramimonas_sp.AAC.1